MKKIFFLTLLVSIIVLNASAQLTTGHVTYKVEVSSDNEMVVSMMFGSTMDVYFNPSKLRTELKMGSMVSTSVIVDIENDKTVSLIESMGSKIATTTNVEEMASAEALETGSMEVVLKEETKVIAGYSCKKAVLINPDGIESVFWYTEEIQIPKEARTGMNAILPGFMMMSEIKDPNMTMTFTAIVVEKTIGDSRATLFSTAIPEGYTIMTQEEIKAIGM